MIFMWHHFQFPNIWEEGKHCQGYQSRQEGRGGLWRGAEIQDKPGGLWLWMPGPCCKPRAKGNQRFSHGSGVVGEAEQNVKEKE